MEKKTRLQTVLEMIQEGNSDEEIAEKLDLTFKRVKNIRKNLIKEGLLERPKTKKERVLEEYKKGKNYKVGSLPMRDLMQLAEIMELLEPDINRLKMFWN